MLLSEAIRLGAMLKPQGFGRYGNADHEASCAVGAAMDADREHAFVAWQALEERLSGACPVCGQLVASEGCVRQNVLPHLNDKHRWTREAIADWVATIEPPETPPAIKRTHTEESAVLVRRSA